MAHLIDKDSLVAEIERRIKSTNNDVKIGALESLMVSKTLNSLISFLDTLEVKEVDLESEMDKYFDEHDEEFCRGEYLDFAKHFFELGVKAKQGQTKR